MRRTTLSGRPPTCTRGSLVVGAEAGARPRRRGPARLPLSVSVVQGDCRRGLVRVCRSLLRQIARAASRTRLYLDDLNTRTLRLPHHVGRFAPEERYPEERYHERRPVLVQHLPIALDRCLRSDQSASREVAPSFPRIRRPWYPPAATRLTAWPNAVRRIKGSIPRKID